MSTATAPSNPAQTPSFQYSSPLIGFSIRILTVLPGSLDAQLRCHLATTSLEKAPEYLALSYCWGDLAIKKTILCDNQELTVTVSQYDVLLQLRSRSVSTPVWIDGICINQNDDAEKASQIRLMTRIYRSASSVVVWLAWKSSVEANEVEMLNSLRSMLVPVWEPEGPAFAMIAKEPHPIVARMMKFSQDRQVSKWENTPSAETKKLVSDYAIFQQPWFRRVWVLQEIVSATRAEFWLGDSSLTMSDVFGKAASISTQEERDKSAQVNLLSSHCGKPLHFQNAVYMSQFRESARYLTMRELLLSTIEYEASDPRDKMFALVGISSDIHPSFVDYTLSKRDVLIKLSQIMLQDGLPSSLAQLGKVVLRSESGLPSWVADWCEKPIIVDDVGDFYRTNPDKAICDVHFDTDHRLTTNGKMLDTIKTVIEAPSEPYGSLVDFDHNIAVANAIINFEQDCANLISLRQHGTWLYPAGSTMLQAYWRTLLLNSTSLTELRMPEHTLMGALPIWRWYMWFLCSSTAASRASRATRDRFTGYDYTQLYRMEYLDDLSTCYLGGFLGAVINSPSFLKLVLAPFICLCIYPAMRIMGACLLGMWSMLDMLIVLGCRHLVERLLKIGCRWMELTAAHHFQKSLAQTRKVKNFCLTERGYIGWCPKAVGPGERLYVLTGSCMPFAFRRRDGGFQLLGACYICGWMNGQAERQIHSEEEIMII